MIDLSDRKTFFTVWKIEWLLVIINSLSVWQLVVEATLSLHPLFHVPYPKRYARGTHFTHQGLFLKSSETFWAYCGCHNNIAFMSSQCRRF